VWSQAYRDDGLVVIGVHTPEFSFEHEIDRVRQATKEQGIDYPVAINNNYDIWSAFDNHYWPATSSTRTASSATATSAKDATSNPNAAFSDCSASTANSSPSKGSAY
jgi:hypothetical protein